jgi:predicted TIM-barrel fold metal-dependent hydrolase
MAVHPIMSDEEFAKLIDEYENTPWWRFGRRKFLKRKLDRSVVFSTSIDAGQAHDNQIDEYYNKPFKITAQIAWEIIEYMQDDSLKAIAAKIGITEEQANKLATQWALNDRNTFNAMFDKFYKPNDPSSSPIS